MAAANKVIRSNSEARLSKLKNKKSQLENLLRSRERLDYEIKNLKRSIAKDQKIVAKEYATIIGIDNSASDEVISETVELEEGVKPRETAQAAYRSLLNSRDELQSILTLLLKYAETL